MSLSRPKIGVSACLLGRPVRLAGGHKRSDFVADNLSRFVDFVHHLRKHEELGGWLARQFYFQPHPKELGAR